MSHFKKPDKMKFELEPNNRNASNEDLLNDLRKVAKELGKETIMREEYNNNKNGKYASSTIEKRFKGWNKTLENLQVLCKEHNLDKGDFYEENQ